MLMRLALLVPPGVQTCTRMTKQYQLREGKS